MKKVLISLLLGVTLVGGLVGCGEATVSKKDYDTLQDSFNDTTKELKRVSIGNYNIDMSCNIEDINNFYHHLYLFYQPYYILDMVGHLQYQLFYFFW